MPVTGEPCYAGRMSLVATLTLLTLLMPAAAASIPAVKSAQCPPGYIVSGGNCTPMFRPAPGLRGPSLSGKRDFKTRDEGTETASLIQFLLRRGATHYVTRRHCALFTAGMDAAAAGISTTLLPSGSHLPVAPAASISSADWKSSTALALGCSGCGASFGEGLGSPLVWRVSA